MADTTSMRKPARAEDLTGLRFSRLMVIAYAGRSGANNKWRVRCDCGTEKLVRGDHLRTRRSASCGCFNRESQAATFTKHGGASFDKSKRHPLYSTWCGIKKRCYDPHHQKFPYYGGRGITVCERWRNDFAAFLADMGSKPTPTHSIDRIDNDRGYEPGNCRWSERSEQMKNRRPYRRRDQSRHAESGHPLAAGRDPPTDKG